MIGSTDLLIIAEPLFVIILLILIKNNNDLVQCRRTFRIEATKQTFMVLFKRRIKKLIRTNFHTHTNTHTRLLLGSSWPGMGAGPGQKWSLFGS